MMQDMEIPVLVIGAGPAGGTLALHLSRLSIPVLVVSRHPSTADTPRAHLQNQRAMEVMRDAGIEEKLIALSHPTDVIKHVSWVHSLRGEEYGRLYSWGNRPDRKGDYERSSPCMLWELSQMKLEPVLVEESKKLGADVRFYTEFISQSTTTDGRVRTILRDRASGKKYAVTSNYLIGADGGRSPVISSLGIPIIGKQLDVAFNVFINADLSKFIKNRPGSLTWVLNSDSPKWPAVSNFRMVEPWTKFVVGMMVELRNDDDLDAFKKDIIKNLHGVIGDGDLPIEEQVSIEIISVAPWTVNDQVAESWQKGPVLCIGDAVHRHPPVNGLGSNTCISDAFNLAWKIAYVLEGKAAPRILESLTPERKPVGDAVVRRANEGMLTHHKIWNLLGLTAEARSKATKLLAEASPDGAKFRKKFRDTISETEYEVNALGMNMNQIYTAPGSLTVVEEGDVLPTFEGVDRVLYEVKSTFPGFHLPHVWVTKDAWSAAVSTLDLAGHGRFTLLTGIGGGKWKEAAAQVTSKGKVEVVAYSIGYRQDYHDAYSDWETIREVEEDGCILIRPDHFIAWRCKTLQPDALAKLECVLTKILS